MTATINHPNGDASERFSTDLTERFTYAGPIASKAVCEASWASQVSLFSPLCPVGIQTWPRRSLRRVTQSLL
jgi:hypothetical protein